MRFHPPEPQGEPVAVQVESQLLYPDRKPTRVPRELSAEAYVEYSAQYGTQQSHNRMLERGGFGILELAVLLFQRIKRLEDKAALISRQHGICCVCGRGPGVAITPDGRCKACYEDMVARRQS